MLSNSIYGELAEAIPAPNLHLPPQVAVKRSEYELSRSKGTLPNQ